MHVIWCSTLSFRCTSCRPVFVSAQFAICRLQNTHDSPRTSHEAGGHSADHFFQPALACHPHSPHSHAPAWLQTRLIHGSCQSPLPSHAKPLLNCLSFAVCQHETWWALRIPREHAAWWCWQRYGTACKRCMHSSARWLTRSYTHPSTNSCTHPSILSLSIHSCIRLFIHSFSLLS